MPSKHKDSHPIVFTMNELLMTLYISHCNCLGLPQVMSSMSLWLRNWIGILTLLKKIMPWDRPPSYCWSDVPQMGLMPHYVGQYESTEKGHYLPVVAAFGAWVVICLFVFLFSPPLHDFLWFSTVPVCIGARTHPAGTLSGISKITVFAALTFLPSSIILTVLQNKPDS